MCLAQEVSMELDVSMEYSNIVRQVNIHSSIINNLQRVCSFSDHYYHHNSNNTNINGNNSNNNIDRNNNYYFINGISNDTNNSVNDNSSSGSSKNFRGKKIFFLEVGNAANTLGQAKYYCPEQWILWN